jgi:hypothetical protein
VDRIRAGESVVVKVDITKDTAKQDP